MQPLVFEHFPSNNQKGFLEDCSITLIDKTDGADITRREEYRRRVLKTVPSSGLNMIDWLFHLGKFFNSCKILCIFLREGCLHNTCFSRHFPSTCLQPLNGSKNSILNWVMKLSLFICCFSWKTLERFSITFTYSSPMVCMYISSHIFFEFPHKTLKFQQQQQQQQQRQKKIQEKYISMPSGSLNFKNFPFGAHHVATELSKQ